MTFCGGELKAETGGGNLVLGNVDGSADIRTGGGNLRLLSAKGFVKAHTTAGNIDLEDIPSADATAEVGSITAKFKATNTRQRASILETSAGDITVFLPTDLHMTIRARVDQGAGHTIRSEVPGINMQAARERGNSSILARGKLSGGGPALEVHTGSGNILFRTLER